MQNKRIEFLKNSDSILAILTTSAKFPKVQKRTQITRITCCRYSAKDDETTLHNNYPKQRFDVSCQSMLNSRGQFARN